MIYDSSKALPRPSLRDQIREAVLERIGSGSLAPGDRIVEADLAGEFGVSAIPVREAIRELVAMRVLEFANHRGAWVRQVSLAETIEALEVKAVLEALAGRLAAPRLCRGCAGLRRECDAILKASKKRDFVAYQNHNQVFHRMIVEAAGHSTLLRMWNTLAFEVRTRGILQFLEKADPVALAREHKTVLDALAAGDGEKAGALLANHSNDLVAHLREEMKAAAVSGALSRPFVSKRTRSNGRSEA
jgi:DNA-binding GntR family transcriptional regulator